MLYLDLATLLLKIPKLKIYLRYLVKVIIIVKIILNAYTALSLINKVYLAFS